MRVRNSFVSNSSSSSFICNTRYSIDEIKKVLKDLLNIQNDFHRCDLSLYHILDIWEEDGKIKIAEECSNSIPFFIKEFIKWDLNGEESR